MHNQIQRYWNKITFIHILKISNIIFKRERKIKLIELIFKKLTLKVPKPHLYYLLQLHKTELVIIKKNIIIRPEKGALCYLLQHHNPMHNNKWKWGLIQLSLQTNSYQITFSHQNMRIPWFNNFFFVCKLISNKS